MLGTGNAAVTKIYNTCFALQRGADTFLVDAGGGNTILSRLEEADIPLASIHDLFVTHAHTDHILGCVWVLRMVSQAMNSGKYAGSLRVWGAKPVLDVLESICRATLPGKVCAHLGVDIELRYLADGDTFDVLGGIRAVSFDIGSTKALQFGFSLSLPDNQSFVCLGDEPFNERTRRYAYAADWLLCEAFCLYEDRARFKPYEKHHSTALDAGKMAADLQVKNLLLYHTEDKTLVLRKISYMQEAAIHFSGVVHVPADLESFEL